MIGSIYRTYMKMEFEDINVLRIAVQMNDIYHQLIAYGYLIVEYVIASIDKFMKFT